ncbi:MAG TPA: enoyl-CoA hydratase/isomerase family protein [Pseudonocardia sp.]|jgi:enoyl-CoA hydratase/carnithine racemase|nr:enoyl-CoA hydratase/isomerase family protein [Pseudonocardia sp.]
MELSLPTIPTRTKGHVLYATFSAPPLNLIGPEVVRDLVQLITAVDGDDEVRVVVFDSADPDFLFPHVDLTKVAEYTAEAGKGAGPDDASLGMLFRRVSELSAITVVKVTGRVRGAGSEFALACDLRYASLERGIFGQPEVGMGAPPGAGALQHLARLVGRGRALEILLSSADYTAAEAERYGWINRALPDAELDAFVDGLAARIASFPTGALLAAKERVNAVTLPDVAEVRADARLFQRFVASDALRSRARTLFDRGFQTRGDVELNLGRAIGELDPAN